MTKAVGRSRQGTLKYIMLAEGLMTTDTTWVPPHIFELEDIIRNSSLGELRVGASTDQIEPILGLPETPPARQGKKSHDYTWCFGNVLIWTADHRVVAIYIDFGGSRTAMVRAGAFARWRPDDWTEFAARSGWRVQNLLGVTSFLSDHLSVDLDEEGALHVVCLRQGA
jgi:hypothetical protein